MPVITPGRRRRQAARRVRAHRRSFCCSTTPPRAPVSSWIHAHSRHPARHGRRPDLHQQPHRRLPHQARRACRHLRRRPGLSARPARRRDRIHRARPAAPALHRHHVSLSPTSRGWKRCWSSLGSRPTLIRQQARQDADAGRADRCCRGSQARRRLWSPKASQPAQAIPHSGTTSPGATSSHSRRPNAADRGGVPAFPTPACPSPSRRCTLTATRPAPRHRPDRRPASPEETASLSKPYV